MCDDDNPVQHLVLVYHRGRRHRRFVSRGDLPLKKCPKRCNPIPIRTPSAISGLLCRIYKLIKGLSQFQQLSHFVASIAIVIVK